MFLYHRRSSGNSAYQDVQDIYAHIIDPNERRRLALAEIDKSEFGWPHIRAIVVAGVGFFTDAYDIFAINLTTAMFGLVFWQSNGGIMPSSSETAIKVATSGGTVIGQIVFGYLADLLGRKRMYGIELMIIIAATLAQSLSAPSTAMSFVGVIIFWRVMMGIGVGGDYPLSAVITSEFANTKWRGAMIGAVFAMQGFGQFAAALLTLVITTAFKSNLEPAKAPSTCGPDCQKSVDIMWRVIIGFGGVPGWFALYYRLTIPETPRYTFDVAHDIEKATADTWAFRLGKRGEGYADPERRAGSMKDVQMKYHSTGPVWSDFLEYFSHWRNAMALLGTAGSWFFLDIAFYGLGLNNSSVLSIIGFSGKSNVYETLYNSAVGNLVLVCAGAIPGYWFTVAFVDTVGRKPIQIMGFTVLTILFATIGFDFHHLSKGSLLALYILAQFFFNFGPNATTFIVPGECFPTRFRATCHGISAASGKIGAIIAQVAFAPMVHRGAHPHTTGGAKAPIWLNHVMQIFALFMLCGVFTSFLIPETRRKSLEELAREGVGPKSPFYEVNFVSGFFNFPKPDTKGLWWWKTRRGLSRKAEGKRRGVSPAPVWREYIEM